MAGSTVLDRWLEAASSLQRQFYLNLAVALVVTYLAFESLGLAVLPPSVDSGLRSKISNHLDGLRPVIALGDSLRQSTELMGDYRRFIARFVAIEDAVQQAVVAVDSRDPRWLGLNDRDRAIVRDMTASLTSLSIALDSYSFDNLRNLHVYSYDEFFMRPFVTPNQLLDNRTVRGQLQASRRVAAALNISVDTTMSIPESFYFVDFIRSSAPACRIPELIDEIRIQAVPLRATLDSLMVFCAANNLTDCTVSTIEAFVDSGGLHLNSNNEPDRIEISFLPTGVERSLFIAVAPLALTFLFFIYLAHWRRFAALLKLALVEVTEDKVDGTTKSWMGLEILLTSAGIARGRLESIVISVFLRGGELMIICSQIAALVFLSRAVGGSARIAVIGVTVLCIVVTSFGCFQLARERASVKQLLAR